MKYVRNTTEQWTWGKPHDIIHSGRFHSVARIHVYGQSIDYMMTKALRTPAILVAIIVAGKADHRSMSRPTAVGSSSLVPLSVVRCLHSLFPEHRLRYSSCQPNGRGRRRCYVRLQWYSGRHRTAYPVSD